MVGIGEDEIAAIAAGDPDTGGFAADDRLLLEAVPDLLARRRTDDAAFAALRDAIGLRQLVELHLVVGLYATIAAVVADLDVAPDPRSGAFELDHDARGPRLGR